MFGEPCNPPPKAKVLMWVWTYMYKENPLTRIDKSKAQGTYDDGKHNGVVILHCKAYIEHILEHHGWTQEFVKNKPVPMKSYPK